MDDEAIYQAIATILEAYREQRSLRSETTIAFATFDGHEVAEPFVAGSMNGAGGLVSARFRRDLPVQYFSINTTINNPTVINVVQNGQIPRVPRHAEMNLIMFAVSLFMTQNPNTPLNNFRLEDYISGINPSKEFCPECQLALALLSRNVAQLFGAITGFEEEGGHPRTIIRGTGKCSARWMPPFANYFQLIQGSSFFRDQNNNRRFPANTRFRIGWDNDSNEVIILQYVGGNWNEVQRIQT